jgi:tetratricopeptide (TPR) repeat protein
LDNVRAALDWSIVRGNDADAGLSLLAHVEWPELLTAPSEALAWSDAAYPRVGEVDDATKARVLRQRVRLEWFAGRSVALRIEDASRAVVAARASGDANEIARALGSLATCYRDGGRFDEAEPLFAQAYSTPELLSPIAANEVLRNWAITDLQRGDLDAARRRFTEVAQNERPGSESHASALLNLGELEFALGDVERARAAARQARESLEHFHAVPRALVACNLAAYAMAADDLDEARFFLREALDVLRHSGSRWLVMALEHYAVLGGLTGEHERAATLAGFTDKRWDGPRQRTEQHGYDRLIVVLSTVYDERELARRMIAGAKLTDEQALEHAAAIGEPTAPAIAAEAEGTRA